MIEYVAGVCERAEVAEVPERPGGDSAGGVVLWGSAEALGLVHAAPADQGSWWPRGWLAASCSLRGKSQLEMWGCQGSSSQLDLFLLILPDIILLQCGTLLDQAKVPHRPESWLTVVAKQFAQLLIITFLFWI